MIKKDWTYPEEKRLIESMDSMTISDLATMLNRTYWSVKGKIDDLRRQGRVGKKKYIREDMMA